MLKGDSMNCPNDNTTLQMTSREGIEIDYCPQCRGVWLDRGELDKLIERSTAAPQGFAPQQGQGQQQYRHDDDDDDNHRSQQHFGNNNDHHKKHKKEGFLGDLFDF